MDSIKKILESLYLGDRFCEKVEFGENKISFQMNRISKLKEGTKEWNYYTDEDIEHGYLVFDNVIEYGVNNKLPFNDEIYHIEMVEKKDDIFFFKINGCNVSDTAVSTDIEMWIRAKRFYVLDSEGRKLEQW